MVASDDSHISYPAPPPEMMGHSPPHSPRATHSPLLFTPQVCFWLLLFFIFTRVL
jgi:5'-AMP-activated protein kinase regulatory beta subunit